MITPTKNYEFAKRVTRAGVTVKIYESRHDVGSHDSDQICDLIVRAGRVIDGDQCGLEISIDPVNGRTIGQSIDLALDRIMKGSTGEGSNPDEVKSTTEPEPPAPAEKTCRTCRFVSGRTGACLVYSGFPAGPCRTWEPVAPVPFEECDECRKKPGCPVLCTDCLSRKDSP